MIKLPLGRGMFVVIEPGNIARMKAGSPLYLREIDSMIAFTPDMRALCEQLVPGKRMADRGEELWYDIRLTAQQIDAALKICQKLPEVMR